MNAAIWAPWLDRGVAPAPVRLVAVRILAAARQRRRRQRRRPWRGRYLWPQHRLGRRRWLAGRPQRHPRLGLGLPPDRRRPRRPALAVRITNDGALGGAVTDTSGNLPRR